MRYTVRTALALSALAIALAGCAQDTGRDSGGPSGGSSDGSSVSSGGSAAGGMDPAYQDGLLKYARCMREHGVDMPDPKPGVVMPALRIDETSKKAVAACEKLIPVDPNAPSAEEIHQRDVELARCLRGKGLDVADPRPGEGMRLPENDQDAVLKALRECRPQAGR
ncbi:hypothetical protein [Microtetraspora niveoalba]|uniref:hypothetical protein n=1 Tax=Microtetraspora niveoalba TaxID=46175 RepID=UPI000829BCE5|nr:hypothetical protein [Microtetraspora niveoalba]